MKTYKREIGVALLVWLGYVVETKSAEIIEILVWPIFAYVTAAFGMHAYASQLQQYIASKPSSKTSGDYSTNTDRQREQSSNNKPDSPD